jgi:hypothetical protein
MQKPPFALKASETIVHLFDARFLSLFLLSAATFINPVNRQPLTHDDCIRLDCHMQEYFTDEQTASVALAFQLVMHGGKDEGDVQRSATAALKQLFRTGSFRKIDVEEVLTIDFSSQLRRAPCANVEACPKRDVGRVATSSNAFETKHVSKQLLVGSCMRIESSLYQDCRMPTFSKEFGLQSDNAMQVPQTKLSPNLDQSGLLPNLPRKTSYSSRTAGDLRKKQAVTWPSDERGNLVHISRRSILRRSDSEFVDIDQTCKCLENGRRDRNDAENLSALVQHAFKGDSSTSLHYMQPEPWPAIFSSLSREVMKKQAKSRDQTIEEELNSLRAIYGEDHVSHSKSRDMLGMVCWEIQLAVWPLRLHILIPTRCFYPTASPLLCFSREDCPLSVSQAKYLLKKFGCIARRDAGIPFLFNWMENFRHFSNETGFS